MTALTPEQITGLLADTRDRGGAERYLRTFATSGEISDVVQDNVQFSAKKVDSLYNSLNQNIAKIKDKSPDFPTLKVIKNEQLGLVLVNLDAHAAALAAAQSENGNTSDSE